MLGRLTVCVRILSLSLRVSKEACISKRESGMKTIASQPHKAGLVELFRKVAESRDASAHTLRSIPNPRFSRFHFGWPDRFVLLLSFHLTD